MVGTRRICDRRSIGHTHFRWHVSEQSYQKGRELLLTKLPVAGELMEASIQQAA